MVWITTGAGAIREKEEIIVAKDYSEVVVTDIKMPFGSMVIFMVKWAIATIPAIIILSITGSIIFSLLRLLFRGQGGICHSPQRRVIQQRQVG